MLMLSYGQSETLLQPSPAPLPSKLTRLEGAALPGATYFQRKEPNCQKTPFSVKIVIRVIFQPSAISRQVAAAPEGRGAGGAAQALP